MAKMFRIIEIIQTNNATFYNFRTNRPARIWPRLLITALVAALGSAYADGSANDFLAGVITVQAILIGFSFSVMFFLVSNSPSAQSLKSIEDELKDKKLTKLSRELFHNISYFNAVALACLISALLWLLPSGSVFSPLVLTYLPANASGIVQDIVECLRFWANIAVKFIFFFTLIESAFTFVRTVGRVNFLFAERLPPGNG